MIHADSEWRTTRGDRERERETGEEWHSTGTCTGARSVVVSWANICKLYDPAHERTSHGDGLSPS